MTPRLAASAVLHSSGVMFGIAGLMLALPGMPWSTALHALGPNAHLPILLLLAASALMVRTRPVTMTPWPVAQASALAIGLILFLQPAVQSLLLLLISWRPSLFGAHLVFYDQHHNLGAPVLAGLTLIRFVVLPAIIEEWFFRGRLLPYIAARLGPISAITLSSLLFAAAHGTGIQVVLTLLLGPVLGLIYLHTGRLYPCIIAHGVHNLIAVLVGGAMTASWDLVLICLLGGAWLLAIAWAHHRNGSHRRLLWTVPICLGVAAVLTPVLAIAHHQAWRRAARQLIIDMPDHRPIAQRLAAQHQAGRLPQTRRQALIEDLWTSSIDARRRWLLLGMLDPDTIDHRAASLSNDEVLAICEDLISLDSSHPHRAEAVLRLSLQHPRLSYVMLVEWPDVAQDMWPWPQYRDHVMLLVSRLQQQDRAAVMRNLLHGEIYDREQAIEAVLHMPAHAITHRDRYILRRNVPDWRQRFEALADSAPEQAAAWQNE